MNKNNILTIAVMLSIFSNIAIATEQQKKIYSETTKTTNLINKSNKMFQAGKQQEAIDVLNKEYNINPSEQIALALYNSYTQSDILLAEEFVNDVITKHPEYVAFVNLKFDLLAKTKSPKKELLVFVNENSNKSTLRDFVFLHHLTGANIANNQESSKSIQKLLLKMPNHPFYLTALAWSNEKNGNLKEALDLYKDVYNNQDLVGQDELIEMIQKKILWLEDETSK